MIEDPKKLIEEQKKSFMDLFTHEKFRFVFVLTRIGLVLLLMIGVLLPMIVGTQVIGGRMSLSQQFGTTGLGIFYWVPFLVSIPGYFLMVLMKKEKLAQIMLLIQVCATSLVLAFGFLGYFVLVRSGFAITLGFGFYMTVVFLAFLWYVFFNEKFLFNLVKKVAGKWITDETDYSHLFIKQPSDLFEEKSIVMSIILAMFTFGIYGLVWLYSMAKKIKMLNEGEKNILVEFLMIMFIPFYILFWLNKAGLRLSEGAKKHNIEAKNNGTLYWVLTLFALGIVAYALLQHQLNQIAKTLKLQAAEQPVEAVEVVEKPVVKEEKPVEVKEEPVVEEEKPVEVKEEPVEKPE